MFGNTFDGVIRNTCVVEDCVVTHAFEGVSPDGHADEVLDALDED